MKWCRQLGQLACMVYCILKLLVSNSTLSCLMLNIYWGLDFPWFYIKKASFHSNQYTRQCLRFNVDIKMSTASLHLMREVLSILFVLSFIVKQFGIHL